MPCQSASALMPDKLALVGTSAAGSSPQLCLHVYDCDDT